MSYEILAYLKTDKRFKRIVHSLSKTDQKEILFFLHNTPKGNLNSHTICKKVSKTHYQYDVPGGEGKRIIYVIDDKMKTVLILFAGDHDEARIFLKRKMR